MSAETGSAVIQLAIAVLLPAALLAVIVYAIRQSNRAARRPTTPPDEWGKRPP